MSAAAAAAAAAAATTDATAAAAATGAAADAAAREDKDALITLPETAAFSHACKIIIIGDSGVGKTAIAMRFHNDTYKEDGTRPTINVEFLHKIVSQRGGPAIKMQLWDTAGQERFHATVSNYYRGVQIAFVVYSVTQPTSFANVQKWVDRVRAGSSSARIWLVGNKCDVDDVPIIDASGAAVHRAIKTDEGLARAQLLNRDEEGNAAPFVSFVETSAKNGFGISGLFTSVAARVVDDNLVVPPRAQRNTVFLDAGIDVEEPAARRGCRC